MKAKGQVEALAALRGALRDGGFSAEWLSQRLGISFPDDVGLLNRAPALERLREEGSGAGLLARLFYLEAAAPAIAVRRALGASAYRALVEARVLAQRGGKVAARMRVDAVGDLFILADRRFEATDLGALGLPPGDMVYPPGSDSIILASVVVPPERGRVLDLCTGSGVQGLRLAAPERAVVAVDIGRRAAAMALVNAELNAVSGFSVRRGDLFAPVAGERFDLIIANPPFVPAPTRGPAYHSGGPLGDRVLQRVVGGLGAHLAPGGRAFAISHLALRQGETVADRVRPWARGFPGRVLALVLEYGSSVDLAAAQGLFALDRGFAAYAAEVRRWVAFLHRHRVERVAMLVLAAERRGRHRVDAVEALQRTFPLPLTRSPHEHVASWLDGK